MKSSYLTFVLILSLALAGCGWNPFHRMYSATAELQLRPRGVIHISPLGPDGGQVDQVAFAGKLQIMQSDEFLRPIIQDLQLDKIWAKRFKSDHDALSPQDALDHLHKVLKIEVVSHTNIFNITACSELPQEAAEIANAVADSYKSFRDREEAELVSRGEESLRDQLTQQQKAVDDAKAASNKLPKNVDVRREFQQQQSLLDTLKGRLKQVVAEGPLVESPVRIISRAVAPPK